MCATDCLRSTEADLIVGSVIATSTVAKKLQPLFQGRAPSASASNKPLFPLLSFNRPLVLARLLPCCTQRNDLREPCRVVIGSLIDLLLVEIASNRPVGFVPFSVVIGYVEMNQTIKSCKVVSESIVKMLRPHSMAIDPEFSIVAETLHRLVRTSLSYSQLAPIGTPEVSSLLLRIVDLATHYQSGLDHLQKDTQAFLRHIQSARLHHPLSIRNVLIFQTLHALSDLVSSFNKSARSKSPTSGHQGANDAQIMRNALSSCVSDVALDDPVASSFWLRNWPEDVRGALFPFQMHKTHSMKATI